MELNKILSGSVLISIIIGGFILFFSAGNVIYSPENYDASSLGSINKMENLTALTSEIKDTSTQIGSQSGVLDILGSFFNSAYQAVKATGGIIDVFQSMLLNINMYFIPVIGEFAGILFNGLNLIVLIIIIVGIFLGIITKSNRT